jgi:hypothetical protein
MAKKQDAPAEAETATEAEARTARIPKGGIVKPEDLGPIADAFIAYQFPEDSHQVQKDSKFGQKNAKTGKFEVSGYRSQYIINALNDIIGPGNWREYGTEECEKPQGASAFVTIYRGTFEIGNWKNDLLRKIVSTRDAGGNVVQTETEEPTTYFEVLAQFGQTGGSRNMDKWESIKGARTNFLKKVCSYIGNGWRAYALVMDEDFESLPPEPQKQTPPPKYPQFTTERAPSTGAIPTAPASAAPVARPDTALITKEQNDAILGLFLEMGYAEEQVPERVLALETKTNKTLAEFTATEAADTIKRMRAAVESKKRLEADKETPGEQQDRLASNAEQHPVVMGATSFEDSTSID